MNKVDSFRKINVKLKEICESQKFEFVINFNNLPFMLTIKPKIDKNQIKMEGIDESIDPDCSFSFMFCDGAISYSIENEFVMSDVMVSKYKNLFKKMCFLFLEIFYEKEVEEPIEPNSLAELLLEE